MRVKEKGGESGGRKKWIRSLKNFFEVKIIYGLQRDGSDDPTGRAVETQM